MTSNFAAEIAKEEGARVGARGDFGCREPSTAGQRSSPPPVAPPEEKWDAPTELQMPAAVPALPRGVAPPQRVPAGPTAATLGPPRLSRYRGGGGSGAATGSPQTAACGARHRGSSDRRRRLVRRPAQLGPPGSFDCQDDPDGRADCRRIGSRGPLVSRWCNCRRGRTSWSWRPLGMPRITGWSS